MKPKLKKKDNKSYIWNAIDIEAKTIIAVHLSTTRTSLDAIHFLRCVQAACDNEPLIPVDRGPWYR